MIDKKGWLKNAEARTNGFYVNGKKEKGANLTQEFCDEWNGVKKAAPAPVVEEAPVVVEEEVAVVEEASALKTFFKKGKKKSK